MNLMNIDTPAYVIDKVGLLGNLKILSEIEKRTGCHILLAQKAFSAFRYYPLIGRYISGTTASGLFEARLGHEEMRAENHCFAPAYKAGDIKEIVEICDHVVFNSVSQLNKYRDIWQGKTSVGIRVNPEYSTQEGHAIYDPCAKGSRLGVTRENLDKAIASDRHCLDGIEGLHFHTLCEQNSDDLLRTWKVVKERFADILTRVKWVNMGGGHHITRDDYDIKTLEAVIDDAASMGLKVYLEPGEAVALNAGFLVTEVMDIVENGIKILILDASAACHMPDVLEMPYRPPLKDSGESGEKKHTYRLSSATCLAGDIIGDYSFDREIKVGDRLVFEDMAIYSMVKNNTFNGMPLPSIYDMDENGKCSLIKKFGYEDFKDRLS
ncbi:MAG: carboxynorspermidine decarboxylase [Lachnospiraceae bacterium]|nr:carboxynorspermidine decarboxylase [Lachnospiraceae bacterium]